MSPELAMQKLTYEPYRAQITILCKEVSGPPHRVRQATKLSAEIGIFAPFTALHMLSAPGGRAGTPVGWPRR
jgi:hypothetical protein